MSSPPRRVPLTGLDYCVLAFDRMMRRANMPGCVSRLVLELDGPIDPEQLKAALADPVLMQFAKVRLAPPNNLAGTDQRGSALKLLDSQ